MSASDDYYHSTHSENRNMFDLLSCDVRLRAFRRASPSASDSDPASDIDNILKIYNDPSLAALVTQKFIVPRGAVLQDDFQRMIESDAEMFCIIESTPKCSIIPRFLGFTALWAHAERGHRHATFSLVLLPEAQNRGVGTILTRFMLERAFVHLNMHRVALSARGDNERALAVYRKWCVV